MNYKDTLAKLLAEENITILREAVSTASFDIKERVLRLPVWEDMSDDVEELFIGHEIAHAKYTDPTKFKLSELSRLKKTILNIVEDNRIERFIKIEYPVFKTIFTRAYKELYDNGFFGECSDLHLIDKINLYSKVGTISNVTFSEGIEKYFFDKVNTTQTPEECLRVTEELYQYTIKSYADSQPDGIPDTLSDIEDDIAGNSAYEKFEGELSKLADTKSVYKSYSTENKLNFYKHVIIKHDIILKNVEPIKDFNVKYDMIDTVNVVSSLCKEFEIRKKAKEYRRNSTYKSGELDSKKLFSYRITDNIFKTRSIQNTGQNHGLIILLDWSSSMGDMMNDCIEQIINLSLFCMKSRIPYRVYAFSSRREEDRVKIKNQDPNCILTNIHLLEFFSSEMSMSDFNKMCSALQHSKLYEEYKFSSTPLNQSLLYCNDILYTFKKSYNVDKTSLIIISDGDDTDGLSISTSDYNPVDGSVKINNTVEDSITKIQYRMSGDPRDITSKLSMMIKDRNKSSIIMFYFSNEIKQDKIKKFGLKLTKENDFVKEYTGDSINKFFLVTSKDKIKIDNSEETDYSNRMKYNRDVRLFLTEFIKEIA